MTDRTPRNEGLFSTTDVLREIEKSDDRDAIRSLAEQLVPLLVAYWDVSPHSAMESLLSAARDLPLALAHPVVRMVVRGWRQKPTYDPTAGGSADHCYLAALIFSENYDLAEHPWADNLLASTLHAWGRDRSDSMRDGRLKMALTAGVRRGAGLR
jgi:hypothetical protein